MTGKAVKHFSSAEIDQFLKQEKVGVLSMADERTPYAVPVTYAYDGENIYLTIRKKGRKLNYITLNSRVCLAIYRIPPDFGIDNMSWASVICEGTVSQLIEPEGIEKAIRTAEQHFGLPAGTWDSLLQTTLKNPINSTLWQMTIDAISGMSG